MFDPSAYVLRWPPSVLRHELRWLLGQDRLDAGAAERLLQEAFAGDEAVEEFRSRDSVTGFGGFAGFGDPWATQEPPVHERRDRRGFLQSLLEQADALPQRHRPRPYWNTRHGLEAGPTPKPTPVAGLQQRLEQAKRGWTDAVHHLAGLGYLAEAAPQPCVDDDDPPPEPGGVLDDLLAHALGVPDLWPLDPDAWDEATFYSLIEAVGDLLARPRRRHWHPYNRCGWHYEAFAITPARLLYRAVVDDLLTRAGLQVRLAADGEDAGRLVHVTGDDRDLLVQRARATPRAADRDAIGHATALFRARAATREDKRSAVVALARVLEERRSLLKAELLSKDEGALFEVANRFDLRHRNADQRGDYDEAYLDWVFWWYLATLELSDQLRARQDSAS